MNKADLVQALSERLDTDRRVAAAALDGVLDVIMETVASGDSVTILGFGTFERRQRAARSGRNPRTGAVIEIPATSVPGFRAGAGFRNVVSGTKEVPRRPSTARSSSPAASAASAPAAVAAVPASVQSPATAATNGAVTNGAVTNGAVTNGAGTSGEVKAPKKAKTEAKKEKPAKAATKKSDTAKSTAGKGGKKKAKK